MGIPNCRRADSIVAAISWFYYHPYVRSPDSVGVGLASSALNLLKPKVIAISIHGSIRIVDDLIEFLSFVLGATATSTGSASTKAPDYTSALCLKVFKSGWSFKTFVNDKSPISTSAPWMSLLKGLWANEKAWFWFCMKYSALTLVAQSRPY